MTQNGMLSPIAKTRAYEQAVEQISARIREGAWQPGVTRWMATWRARATDG